MSDGSPSVDPQGTIVVRNTTDQAMDLVLEPWGEVYGMAPGQDYVVAYHGPRPVAIAIEIGTGESKIWFEGPPDGYLELQDLAPGVNPLKPRTQR